jgi:VWFA-related protein
MPCERPVRQLFSFLVLLAIAIHPAAGQSQTGQPAAAPTVPAADGASDETFYESLDVNVVNVEVFVTDRQGNRVTGLTRDDFRILEDGKPVEITNFYAAEATKATAAAPGTGGTPEQPEEVPAEQSLQLAVFIDTTNLARADAERLQQAVAKFLATRSGAGDRILIASYSGQEKFAIRPVRAADATAVREALSTAVAGAPALPARLMQLRQLLMTIKLGKDPANTGDRADAAEAALDIDRIAASMDSYAKQVTQDCEVEIEILDRFLNGLAGLPGRKAVLWVGGSLPLLPIEGIFGSFGKKYGGGGGIDPRQNSLRPLLRKVEERANANRITVYALGDTEDVMASYAANPYGVWNRTEEERERSGLARALDDMALPTGGLADLNASDPGVLLARMGEDLDSYYSLGYTPARRRPGAVHALDVQVRRPGLTVRHRQSYRDRDPAETLADRTVSALYFDVAGTANPLELAVQLANEQGEQGEEAGEKGQQKVRLTLKLPFAKLVVLPRGSVHEGKLQVAVAVRDAEGRASRVSIIEVPVRIPNDQLQAMFGRTVGYETRLAMRPMEHVVAVSVRDELGNVTSTVTAAWRPDGGVTVPASSP